jgi:hypothetical protein
MIKQQKVEYNSEIKEYNSLIKSILSEETKVEDIEKTINKLRYKQKMTISMITDDFVKHFNDFTSHVPLEVIESLMEFFGYIQTPYYLLKVKLILYSFTLLYFY